jgi:uncharacterized RDD family membrane protein YckC
MTKYDARETDRMLAVHGSELATFPRRATAFLLDLAIAAVFFALIASLLEPFLLKKGWIQSEEEIAFGFNMNWYSAAWIVLYFGCTAYFWNGRTPGKRALGIRIVSLVHERMSLWHSVERALGYGFSVLEGCFGFVQYFTHPNKRTLHDRIAETIVIRERRKKAVAKSNEKTSGREKKNSRPPVASPEP